MNIKEVTLNTSDPIKELARDISDLSTAMADMLKVVAKIEKRMAERAITGLDIQEIS